MTLTPKQGELHSGLWMRSQKHQKASRDNSDWRQVICHYLLGNGCLRLMVWAIGLTGVREILSIRGFPYLSNFGQCPVLSGKINLPTLQGFVQTYQASGLNLISVHMPRMEEDTDIKKVEAVAKEFGLTGPCAIDNQHILGDRFQTGSSWPYYFLFDADGKLRSRAAGLTGIKMAENSLKRLLDLGVGT